jgi:hypothetical protein
MAADLAKTSYFDTLLDFDEGPDFGVVPDLTAIKIHQFGVMDNDIFPEFDVGRNGHGIPLKTAFWSR